MSDIKDLDLIQRDIEQLISHKLSYIDDLMIVLVDAINNVQMSLPEGSYVYNNLQYQQDVISACSHGLLAYEISNHKYRETMLFNTASAISELTSIQMRLADGKYKGGALDECV